MPRDLAPPVRAALVEYLLRLGDDRLILGHRLSEWCGHGPILEEDIALANLALDCLGQAANLLRLAGELEGRGRSEDALAFLRDEVEFRNLLLVEQPRGDFAFTIARQLLFSAYSRELFGALRTSTYAPLADIAGRAWKETQYHVRHSAEWLRRLGDSTNEAHRRAERALDELWRFTGEMFESDPDIDGVLDEAAVAPRPAALQPAWRAGVEEVLSAATLQVPGETHMATGGRRGRHSEHLGHLLAEMQIVARSHPGARW